MKSAFAVFQIPETTIEINGIIKVYHNGEICEAIWHVPMQDVQKALLEGRENYFDPDEKYVLSDEARTWMEQHDGSIAGFPGL